MSAIIKAEHLWFSYPDATPDQPPILTDVNLEIEAGSFVAILGHNGSGKSTLAKHINALLTPTQGKLWVDGLDTSLPENLLPIREKVGMVFQNPDNQIVASVVEEDVAFGPENMGVPPKAGGSCLKHGGDVRISETLPPPALRRPETACGHRWNHRHDAPVHHPR